MPEWLLHYERGVRRQASQVQGRFAAFRPRPPPINARRAPSIGQHSDAVLAEAGYSAEAIGKLRAVGVLA